MRQDLFFFCQGTEMYLINRSAFEGKALFNFNG